MALLGSDRFPLIIAGPGGIDYPAVSTAQTSWVPTVVKGTSSPGRSEWTPRRQQEREVEKVRSQNFNIYKQENERLLNYSRVRSYDYERKRSWEKEERLHGEHRHRDREEESSKHKSSRRKQESEEREPNRRHKRKKSKRTKEKSIDNEPTTKGNRHDLREKTTSTSRLGSV
ncbi:hypothetical protein GDO78_013536 [Eleutherodactylus coqui]|uniref:Uncharacterized protein n=1 Tax=Eleutherodactylus coqui TaxID=57060 RepID=A0A8J6K7P4_ELECQ|nr:hypothetical protein GDO78_013536 [Eleutherodactylus coqui]